MDPPSENILSNLLKKRLKTLGYPSLRKFHADRPGMRLSYEVLRQVVYIGRVPRPETLFRILGSMQFSSTQIRKICGMHYGDYLPMTSPAIEKQGIGPGTEEEALPPRQEKVRQDPDSPAAVLQEEPGETLSRLHAALPQIPFPGNEDFWEMAQTLARIAEQKVHRATARHAEQPLLFAGEPEAIYQFLVRKNRIPPFMSRGENLVLEVSGGIDYRERFVGAMLGAAVGELLGAVTQGLTPRDIRELYGEAEELPSMPAGRGAPGPAPVPALLAVARSLLPGGILDPERTAEALARSVRREDAPSLQDFSKNLLERGLPWYEAGEAQPDGAPAVIVLPLALLRAGSFRRLKLEAGILASLSHPHPAAIAGTIAQACAVAKVLHAPAGTLDVLSFPRAISPVVAGVEPERGSRPRVGRAQSSVGRKLGAELPALLLRRAPVYEMQETLGNGTAAHEGIPFALGCFLRAPGDFAESVLPAVHHGGDARAVGGMVGALCGACTGSRGIPERFLSRLPYRQELSDAALELLALARREG